MASSFVKINEMNYRSMKSVLKFGKIFFLYCKCPVHRFCHIVAIFFFKFKVTRFFENLRIAEGIKII